MPILSQANFYPLDHFFSIWTKDFSKLCMILVILTHSWIDIRVCILKKLFLSPNLNSVKFVPVIIQFILADIVSLTKVFQQCWPYF